MDSRSILARLRAGQRSAKMKDLAEIALTIQLAILLGIVNKLFLLVVAAFFPVPAPVPELFDFASRVTWSLIVCGALGVAAVADKWWGMEMGIAGFLGAPIAFDLARAVRRGSVGYLQLVEASGQPAPLAMGLVKAVEYGCLGVLLGRMATRGRLRARSCALAGLGVGGVFGGIILILQAEGGPLTWGMVGTWLVNELLFPIGCSLLLFLVGVPLSKWAPPADGQDLGRRAGHPRTGLRSGPDRVTRLLLGYYGAVRRARQHRVARKSLEPIGEKPGPGKALQTTH